MPKNVKEYVLVSGFLFCAIFYWANSEWRYAQLLPPPGGATNLVSFLRAQHDQLFIQQFAQDGQRYLIVKRLVPKVGFSLPSGPPAYIFNEPGTLVDWTGDFGEATRFLQKWTNLSEAKEISIEAAKAFVTQGKPGVP